MTDQEINAAAARWTAAVRAYNAENLATLLLFKDHTYWTWDTNYGDPRWMLYWTSTDLPVNIDMDPYPFVELRAGDNVVDIYVNGAIASYTEPADFFAVMREIGWSLGTSTVTLEQDELRKRRTELAERLDRNLVHVETCRAELDQVNARLAALDKP